jgi:alkylhydroperoxidase/carboxymuconolactone decarboxylase family protein YurZ
MTAHSGLNPSGRLRQSDPTVAAAFQAFRDAARTSGPLDLATVELILLAGFATAGQQVPFKNHAMRALRSGMAKEALRQAVIVTLGATSILPVVANALGWLDDVHAEFCAQTDKS